MFNNLVKSLGVIGAEFEELWSLNDYSLRSIISNYGDVYGLILIFKYQASANDNRGENNNTGVANKGGRG